MHDLNELRKQIDEIDEQLIQLLAERFKVTQKVGEYKMHHDVAPIDLNREKLQFEKIEKLAQKYGIDPDFASSMLRLIIDAVVVNHRQIQASK